MVQEFAAAEQLAAERSKALSSLKQGPDSLKFPWEPIAFHQPAKLRRKFESEVNHLLSYWKVNKLLTLVFFKTAKICVYSYFWICKIFLWSPVNTVT